MPLNNSTTFCREKKPVLALFLLLLFFFLFLCHSERVFVEGHEQRFYTGGDVALYGRGSAGEAKGEDEVASRSTAAELFWRD